MTEVYPRKVSELQREYSLLLRHLLLFIWHVAFAMSCQSGMTMTHYGMESRTSHQGQNSYNYIWYIARCHELNYNNYFIAFRCVVTYELNHSGAEAG